VRVEGTQPFAMVLSVHGGVLTLRALSRQQTIVPRETLAPLTGTRPVPCFVS
jgi:hypothetical protein